MALVDVKNGQTCLFWQDTWGDVNLRVNSPELFSFAKKQVHLSSKGMESE
jgi:hypothetical protein